MNFTDRPDFKNLKVIDEKREQSQANSGDLKRPILEIETDWQIARRNMGVRTN